MVSSNLEAWVEEFGQRHALPEGWSLGSLDSLLLASFLNEHLSRSGSSMGIDDLMVSLMRNPHVWDVQSELIESLRTLP